MLVLHGALDRSVYATEAPHILAGIPHAQSITWPQMGHMWYDYYTLDYWAALLGTFLADGDMGAFSRVWPAGDGGKSRL